MYILGQTLPVQYHILIYKTCFGSRRVFYSPEAVRLLQYLLFCGGDADSKIGLKDVLEEAASIVVILRLWRVFKIVEEFSAGASDQMEVLGEKMEKLEAENQVLKRELKAWKDNNSGQ